MRRPERWRKLIRWGVSLAVLGISLWLALRVTEWGAFLEALRQVQSGWLWTLVPVVLLSHLVRAWRWQLLLRAALGQAPRVLEAFSAVMIGYAVNALLPRAGELVRPYILSRRAEMPLAVVLSSVVAERFLDVLTLAALGGIGAVLFADHLGVIGAGGWSLVGSLLLALALATAGVVVVAYAKRWGRFLLRWLQRWSPWAEGRGARLLEGLQQGLSALGQPRLYGALALLTVAMWVCYWLPLYGLCRIFALPLGPLEAFELLVISAVAIAVAPTPSAAGVYHVTVQLALVELFGVGSGEALAYAVVAHGLSTLLVLLVGGICWMWEHVRLR